MRRLRFPRTVRDGVSARPARYLVTGAGGWLGQATLEMLDDALGERLSRDVHAFASTKREHILSSGRRVPFRPLSELAELPVVREPTYLAHYAFLTREKTTDRPLASYIATNRRITATVIEEARRLRIAGAFVTSSGAVYAGDGSLSRSIDDNPYGTLKREEEEAFSGLAAEGCSPTLCRVFNLSGPFINKAFALNSFIEDALAGRPIRIESARPVFRSYSHVRDVVAIGFAGMLQLTRQSSDPFDTAGEETVEVADLARRVLTILGLPSLRIVRPPVVQAGGDRYVGDGTGFRARCAESDVALVSLDDQIADTAAYIKAQQAKRVRVG